MRVRKTVIKMGIRNTIEERNMNRYLHRINIAIEVPNANDIVAEVEDTAETGMIEIVEKAPRKMIIEAADVLQTGDTIAEVPPIKIDIVIDIALVAEVVGTKKRVLKRMEIRH